MNPLPTTPPGKTIPPLAGLCRFDQAARPALAIEACVGRLKRYHYAFKRLHEIFNAKITSEPVYELKTAFSYHSYLCAEHVSALRERVGEMREPPLGLEAVPDENLAIVFDEVLNADSTSSLLTGLYQVALPALNAALKRHERDSNPLVDAPSLRILRFARLEIEEMVAFGNQAIEAIVGNDQDREIEAWKSELEAWLKAAGGLDGSEPLDTESAAKNRRFSKTPYVYDPIPKRDSRFQDLYNQGVNPEAFLYNPAFDPKPKALMMLFKRIREIDVPEMMASIIHETKGQPWAYYHDMTRQLWDEARHAMMGEVGFVALGIDWTQARITHNWSLRLNTECLPLERHAVLYFIEQGLMAKTGKRYEWEVGRDSGLPLMATIQDYDWADEVLHARIGRQWYVPQLGDWKKALAYGDACWSRITSNWTTVRDQGLTEHENWWPAIYRQACERWGTSPDPEVLAYNETYETQRADLKTVSGSG